MSGSFVHNSIIAGCRCLAGHLPSSPTKRDTMPLGDHLAPSSTSRHLITIGLTASLAAALLAVISITGEDDKHALTTPESIESSSSAAARSTTTPRQLVSRLREILRIREAAYRSRNPDLLRSVYSSDCPCLASDEKAIYELLQRAYIWDGIETSVEIRRVTKYCRREVRAWWSCGAGLLVVVVESAKKPVEVGLGVAPVERRRRLLVAALEGQQASFDLVRVGEVVGR
jgi:hypothetical protein